MPERITWATAALELTIAVPQDAPAGVAGLRALPGAEVQVAATPLAEVLVLGDGRSVNTTRLLTGTACGARLRYVDHDVDATDRGRALTVRQRDDRLGLEVHTRFVAADDVPALRVTTTVRNTGSAAQVLEAVPTLMLAALVGAQSRLADVELVRGTSSWCAENRWSVVPLVGDGGLVRMDSAQWPAPQSSTVSAVGRSTWSTDGDLPLGVVHDPAAGRAVAWQVEHNGPWRWEIDWVGTDPTGIVLGMSGPTWQDHQWAVELQPGESFTSVPASVAVGTDVDDAIGALTRHRRWLRGAQPGERRPLLVFNDYMNTLMGDPTEEKLLPLIDAAAEVGAEVFCIDAGWYDDGRDWWPSVGEWVPSATRFPSGLPAVLQHIRYRGLVPGLWVEPEVIGVRSPMAGRLPDSAFFRRAGRRVVEHGRYLLDLSDPAARAHLDEVFDRLVGDHAVGYFKLDYNVTPGTGSWEPGTTVAPGAALLAHTRGYLTWFQALRARYPDVVFENCGSGAMRQDFSQLERFDLQSTSDQTDFRLYAPIAAGAPMMVNLEQAASWAYPHASMDGEAIAFTMVTGLSGRLYQSGLLDAMDTDQRALVREGAELFLRRRDTVHEALPFWPAGMPAWDDDAVALGWQLPDSLVLYVWWRGDHDGKVALRLPVPVAPDRVTQAYPRDLLRWGVEGGHDEREIVLLAPTGPTARVFTITR